MSAAPAGGGAFAPLRHRLFGVLWVATILGNVGTFMRDVASAWLVTDLSPSPFAVAAIQAAGTLPIFLLAIPAGVLSDILDRRRFLIGVQIFLGLVSGLLALTAVSGMASVPLLVGLTFLGGVGAALAMPSWQAIVPELVPRPDLRPAIALNSLGLNIARAIGPALGGFVVAAAGAATTYVLDVLTYVAVIGALLWWKRTPAASDGLREQFGGALRAGLRYAKASPPLRLVLLRAFLFFCFASAVWALLPLVARQSLGGGSGFYGLLLGSIGAGAIAGALVMPRVRGRLGQDRLVLAASLLTAAATGFMAVNTSPPLAIATTFLLGMAWITILTTLNGTVQSILPNWVRGRGLAIYLTLFNGAMTIGSLGWGALAERAGTTAALLTASALLALFAIWAVTRSHGLPAGEDDLTPSLHWPEPALAAEVGHDRGPVMITIAYRVRAEDRPAFLAALAPLSAARRRDGAYAWGVSEDAADPERLVEWFFVESWAEHLRQHQRVSNADADVQRALQRFHIGPQPPEVAHLLALDPRGAG